MLGKDAYLFVEGQNKISMQNGNFRQILNKSVFSTDHPFSRSNEEIVLTNTQKSIL